MGSSRTLGAFVAAGVVAAVGASAQAQFATGFEPPVYRGSPDGVPLGTTDGWYTPVTTPVSLEHKIYTYADNVLSIPTNPTGGSQFDAGVSNNGTSFARAERPVDLTSRAVWTVSYDFLGANVGAPPAVDNLGSWSLQPSTTAAYFQSLFTWGTNTGAPTQYNQNYIWFNAAGTQNGTTGAPPGPEWTNLQVNHWYRASATFNVTTHQILSVSITDLVTNTTATVNPTDAYLAGGANSTRPLATATRLFVGGGSATNTNIMAFDNFSTGPRAPWTSTATTR
jgi:hypothetical protein